MPNISLKSSEDIYEELCSKIEKLEYMPGDGISENELSKQYGVTRYIVRGAFTKLKERRLIEVYPQRGTFVSLIDIGYVEDILYLREAVEQESLRRVIRCEKEKRDEVAAKMKDLINRQQKAMEKDVKLEDFYQADNEYHQCMMTAIGKEHVMDLIKEQDIHVRRWRNFEVRDKERLKEIIKDHQNIVEAIEHGEEKEGWEYLHVHLDTVGRLKQSFQNAQKEYFIFR